MVYHELQVVVDYPLKHMSRDNKEAAEKAINRIRSGGGTNLSGGLFKGIDQHQQGAAAQDAVVAQSQDNAGSWLRDLLHMSSCTRSHANM